ncbi:collectin-10 [Aedes albopictus]|uniref:C-type lectin domain-containing protein n=1 Tax=Aedes albopictus TaxID=7160 RepID=A0ABM2A1F0_AEDAL
MVRLLVLLLCISITTTQKPGSFSFKEKGFKSNHNYDVDPQVLEIQRQNLITQKILQRYLERRLHPERKPQIRVPSVDEILPKPLPPGSVRDVRQQNATLSGNPLLKGTAAGSRYSLFNDYNNKQYESLDGDEESMQHRGQGLIGEDYDDDGEGDLDQYEDLGGSLDNDHIDIESLQSGESEHVDSFYRDKFYRQRASQLSDCPNCVEDSSVPTRWTMPLLKLGEKRYYLSIFFKANWFKALQYCRYHGMQLASIQSQEENDRLEKYVKDYGLAAEHFWTSGTDLAEEGSFFWISNGRPLSFTNWNAGEPNNFRYENGEEEHCLELWNRDGKGLKWNDTPCSFETYFICEV